MTEQAASFGGIARRLVQDGLVSANTMQMALAETAASNTSIVAHLIANGLADPYKVAVSIAHEFGDPLLDLNSIDQRFIPQNLVGEKIIKEFKVLPLYKRGNRLFVAMSDPSNIAAIDAIRFNTKLAVDVIIVEENKKNALLKTLYDDGEASFGAIGADTADFELDIEEDQEPDNGVMSAEEEAPIVKFINKLLIDAIRMGASDLHFEPYEKIYRVRYRIDGVMREISKPPIQLANKLAARLKVMAQMDISERRMPQDGRIKLRVSKSKAIDFRVNSLPTLFGEKIVLRILDSSSAMMGIDALGYEEVQKELFLEALHRPQGMLLITGPTGSGKTVSLYTGLNILNTVENNISTAEDPVEINLEGINQVNVNYKTGLDFSTALKSFLRQDPDIIMVGEVRDLETAEIAIKAAQTGHMVMSTLHTNSAAETLTRLRNMGVPSFNIATSVNLVIAQRLARRLCSHCKTAVDIPVGSLLEMGFTQADIETGFKVYAPKGCGECRDGYKGRLGIYEVMKVTPEISRIIMEDGNSIQIAEAAIRAGYHNLRRAGLNKVMSGLTSLQEVNRVTSE